MSPLGSQELTGEEVFKDSLLLNVRDLVGPQVLFYPRDTLTSTEVESSKARVGQEVESQYWFGKINL